MVTVEFFSNSRFYKPVVLPENLGEFDLDELLIFANALNKNVNKYELLRDILNYRIKKSNSNLPRNWGKLINTDDVFNELTPLIDVWLKENNLLTNPFPHFCNEFYGPDSSFDNLLVGEYEVGEVFINLYVQSQDIKYLLDLVKYLWRPLDANGKRVSAENYDYEKSFLKSIDEGKLQLIYLWWVGCKNLLVQMFQHVFVPGTSEDYNHDDDSIALPITQLIHSAAGDRNGTRREIRWSTTVKEFFLDCDLQQAQADKIKKEQ